MGPRFEGTHEARNNTDSCGLVPLPTATLRTDPLRGVPLMSIRSALNLAGILALIILVAPGLVRPGVQGQTSAPPASPGGDPPSPPERVEVAGIENLYRLGPRLYSGGQPEGVAGFEALKRLGVRTIVSVDGARPDVEAARLLGMSYVHLPVGYDGIPRDQAVRLAKAARDLPGPIFVHCHHGKHRGPAAAAICLVAVEGWDKRQARAWLEKAGTDPAYKGLFATVDWFVPPSAEEWGRVGPGDLPEQAKVPALVETMVEADRLWDRLKAIRKAGFRTPSGQPDLDPPHESRMLAERFRESLRHEEAEAKGDKFTQLMRDSERAASALEDALREFRGNASLNNKEMVESAFARAGQSCTTCHARFRDERGRR